MSTPCSKSRLLQALALLIAVPLAATVRVGAQTADAITGDADAGQRLFTRFGCYACHLYTGAGYVGAPGGANLVPMRLSESAFTVYLRNPPLARRMPPYTEDVLSQQQAADIYAFIRSLPEPRAAREIPLLEGLIDEPGDE